ncbi:glycosyltransferase [Actinobacillus pleuropneumoniae]|uniref:alpha-1,6-glucosyltransferase n=1 Tax=Actinobacillus pleuropneumoniae TaxID=715 RepID=UPI003AAD738F
MENNIDLNVYFCFVNRPCTGGDFVNLDHVRTLRKLGINASILLAGNQSEEIVNSFGSLPVVILNEEIEFSSQDIFIVPEVMQVLYDLASKMTVFPRMIMHNQNPFYTGYGFLSAQHINEHRLERIIVPSSYTKYKLQEIGVTKPIDIIHPYIPDYFKPAEKQREVIQIAFSRRKRSAEFDIFKFYFLSLYSHKHSVNFVNIQGLIREEVAKVMSEAAIFISFAERESLGLMTLEAMASGCHVIGFSGYTDIYNNEVIDDSVGDWIGEGEYTLFAQKVCQAIDDFVNEKMNPKIENGLRLVEQRFRIRHFEQGVKRVYGNIFDYDLENSRS